MYGNVNNVHVYHTFNFIHSIEYENTSTTKNFQFTVIDQGDEGNTECSYSSQCNLPSLQGIYLVSFLVELNSYSLCTDPILPHSK